MDFRALVDRLPDCVFVTDEWGTVIHANARSTEVIGISLEDAIGRSMLDIVHPDDAAGVVTSYTSMQHRSDLGTPIEVRVRNARDEWLLFEIVGVNAVDDPGIGGMIGVARDLTQRRMWEVAANDTSRFQMVLHSAPGVTLLLDEHGMVTSVNGAFVRLLRHDLGLVIGRPLVEFVAPEAAADMTAALERLRTDERMVSIEVPMLVADAPGTLRPFRFEMANLLTDPVVAGIVVSAHDVTELEVARRDLEHLARHDSLTGLANRAFLVDHVERLLAMREDFAVLFIDLDRFKPVNDEYGHETGDELLRRVAARLTHAIRAGDVVARVGGDEFVVVAAGIDSRPGAYEFADRIEEALVAPYQLDVGLVDVGASIGIAIPEDGSTVDSLLADADVAMYGAKSERRSAVARPAGGAHRTALERRRLADEFATGLARGEVVAHFQPIVAPGSGDLLGVEAVARWQHPTLGVQLPASFMDLAEAAGLEVELGEAVLDAAASVRSGLALRGVHVAVGIDMTVGQLTDPALVSRTRALLDRHGVSPAQLTVEIAEQAMATRRVGARAVSAGDTLRALSAMGATLAVDHFGAATASLTQVRRLPFGAIKIDAGLVRAMSTSRHDRALVEVIVGLGRALDLRVIAQGVDDEDARRTLGAMGCDAVQGNAVSAPLDGPGIVEWILAHRPTRPD